MADGRLNDDRDVEQILKLAVRNAGFTDEDALRQRLQLAGHELGLTDKQIAAAEEQYYRDQEEQQLKKEFQSDALHEFWEHLWSYVIVNAGMIGFDVFKDGTLNWAMWPLIGWGIGLAFHAYGVFFPGKQDYEKEFSRWKQKRGRRRNRRRGVTVGVKVGKLDRLAEDDEAENELRSQA